MAKLKIGVFGAFRGMTMVHQILGTSDAELVAVCDKFQPALDHCREVAEEAGMNTVAYYNNFEVYRCRGLGLNLYFASHDIFLFSHNSSYIFPAILFEVYRIHHVQTSFFRLL